MTGTERPPTDDTVGTYWEELLADAADLADELREEGWEVIELEPGDVTPIPEGERRGFSVLLPDDEYETVERLVEEEGLAFDTAQVYRRAVAETAFVLAVELDEDAETAVVVPLYYYPAAAEETIEAVLEAGEVLVHVRPLSVDRWVTFSHDDPSLFVVGDEAGADGDGESEREGGSAADEG